MEIGDEVICIDDSIQNSKIIEASILFQNWVKKGRKYKIRELLDNDGIVDGVLLEEIHNKPIFQKLLNREQEPAFGLFRFSKMEREVLVISEEISEQITV